MDILIFMGLQGAGKSTFYRSAFAATHAYVSKDALRNNRQPARRQQQLIEEALQAGRSLVVDNTNPTVQDRAPLIALGHQYGALVIGYYFEPQVERSIERNKLRSGKARVPLVAIFATRKKLTPPAYKEGFDQLYCVNVQDNFQFEILPWRGGEEI
ncbi:MAG: hypothetical protein NVS4B9_20610 [Ktedonobacteraceae bacterium]